MTREPAVARPPPKTIPETTLKLGIPCDAIKDEAKPTNTIKGIILGFVRLR